METVSDKVNELYSCYEILKESVPNNIAQKEATYRHILNAVNGSDNERKLACQFIPVFFKYFPNLVDDAVGAMFDLCEDTNVAIRRQAIKELPPAICRENSHLTKRVTLILSQLLVVKDPVELRIVSNTIISLINIDIKAAITALFLQLNNGEDTLRSSCLRLLVLRMDSIFKTDGVDVLLFQHLKKLLQGSSLDEIPVLVNMALSTKRGNTSIGKANLISIITELIEQCTPFNPMDDDLVKRIVILLRQFSVLLSKHSVLPNRDIKTDSSKIIMYICENILPKVSRITGYFMDTGYGLEIIMLLAAIAFYTEHLNCENAVGPVFELLMELLPYPECKQENKVFEIHYSYIECLLFTFHKLTRNNHEQFVKNSSRLKNFKIRLQRFASIVQGYTTHLYKNLNIANNGMANKVLSEHGVRKRKLATLTNDGHEERALKMHVMNVKLVPWKDPSQRARTDGAAEDSAEGDRDSSIRSLQRNNHIRILAYKTCSNIMSLINDILRRDITGNCETKVILSFMPHEASDEIEKSSGTPNRNLPTNSFVNDPQNRDFFYGKKDGKEKKLYIHSNNSFVNDTPNRDILGGTKEGKEKKSFTPNNDSSVNDPLNREPLKKKEKRIYIPPNSRHSDAYNRF